MEVYSVPLIISLFFVAANQIKFCLLNEGDLEEDTYDMFDQRHYFFNSARPQNRHQFMNQRDMYQHFARGNRQQTYIRNNI